MSMSGAARAVTWDPNAQISHGGSVPDLSELLRQMVELGASDLHITAGVPPQVRIDGSLSPMPYAPLDPKTAQGLLYAVMSDEQRAAMEDKLEIDFSFGVKDLARFRANVFMQRGSVAGALRVIPWRIPSFDELRLPQGFKDLCNLPRGLVLVTGPTGSGKSDLTPQNGSRDNLTIWVEEGRSECRRRGTAQSRSYGSYGRLRWSWPEARRSRMPAAS